MTARAAKRRAIRLVREMEDADILCRMRAYDFDAAVCHIAKALEKLTVVRRKREKTK